MFDDGLSPPQQIRIEPGGCWHRRQVGNGRNHTACGIELPEDLIVATRYFKLDELLCLDGCFSEHELELGHTKALARDDEKYPGIAPGKRPSEEMRPLRRRRPRNTIPDEPDEPNE